MVGEVEIPRVMLHARTLGFTHPATGNVEDFTKPMPGDMERVMYALEQLIIPGEMRGWSPMHAAEDAC
jgi:23S rRNA pseudouridine1911/1915/1917 synthase